MAPTVEVSYHRVGHGNHHCLHRQDHWRYRLSDEVRRAIPKTKLVVVDLANVRYVDSSSLGAPVGMYVSARRANVGMKLVKLNDRIAELLRLTQLAAVFEAYGEHL